MAVIADGGRGGIFRGTFWDAQTNYAVLDIDASSQYHSTEKLARLLAAVESVGLAGTLYQSSDSSGWHLYLPFTEDEKSSEVEHTLKRWLKALGYEIRGGQLEIFPSGNALRLPLQAGFAWLNPDGELVQRREDLTLEQAVTKFLRDREQNARDWQNARSRIERQIYAADRAAGIEDQARQERLETDSFEKLFSRGKIQENWEKGRRLWEEGLSAAGQRHDAVLFVGHYLWCGDSEKGIAALPGSKNDEYRAKLIEHWLIQKHNGFCRHIDQNKWKEITDQIRRAVNWRGDGQARQYEPYRVTDRLLKRLIALYRKTGKLWTIEEFEKANQDRRLEARARIAEAVVTLEDQGRVITIAEVARRAGAHWSTVKKNVDLLARSLGEYNRGGTGVRAVLAAPSGSEFQAEKKEELEPKKTSVLEIESASQAGCVLDSLRSDSIGQTAINSRQVTSGVLAAVHPIQSNYGVKHELQGPLLGHLVATEGRDCGINGFLPASGSPPFNPRPFFSIGAPAPNLRQVGNRLDGSTYKSDEFKPSGNWISQYSQAQQLDKPKSQAGALERASGYVPLSCYVRSVAQSGRRLLSSNGYIACRAEGNAMGNEANDKHEQPHRPTERQTDYEKRAQGEVNANVSDYTEKVIATRLEKKLSGNSGVTGKYPDENGKGLASAKELLGDNAHGLSKKEKQAALLAQVEKDGYIVGKPQDKPILVAEKLEEQKKTEKNNERLTPKDGETYSLKQLLSDYKTPFFDAYERSKHLKDGEPGKSKTLEAIVDRLKECPWTIHFKFDSTVSNPEYDPVKSTITIRPQDSPADQIELLVHEGFHSTHQALKEMFMGDKPVEPKKYAEILGTLEAKSFEAEIRVHNELTAKMGAGPVTYEWRDAKNKAQPTMNLGDLYAKKGLEGVKHFVLDEAFTDMKLDGQPHSWNYRTYYEATQPKYAAAWQGSHDVLNKRIQQDPKLKTAIETGGF